MREETLYELETPYRQKFKIKGFRFGEGEKACAMVAAVRGNEVQQMYVCALLVQNSANWKSREPLRPATSCWWCPASTIFP